MNHRTRLIPALVAFALVFSLTAWSQETHPSKAEGGQTAPASSASTSAQAPSAISFRDSPERYFRLEFRVLDISPEGKVADSRSYNEIIVTGPKSTRDSSIRTEDQVPVVTKSPTSNVVTSTTHFDLGTNFDVQEVAIVNRTLRLWVQASIRTSSSTPPASSKYPITRDASWKSYVTIPINKPTLIFSSDNNADKGKIELELTAVPIGQ